MSALYMISQYQVWLPLFCHNQFQISDSQVSLISSYLKLVVSRILMKHLGISGKTFAGITAQSKNSLWDHKGPNHYKWWRNSLPVLGNVDHIDIHLGIAIGNDIPYFIGKSRLLLIWCNLDSMWFHLISFLLFGVGLSWPVNWNVPRKPANVNRQKQGIHKALWENQWPNL